mgnify:CR=1 FL=1|tara:strand:- start:7385 stop:8884 length:1500 start_codon:yes stop_codon:yes gene_type:complete
MYLWILIIGSIFSFFAAMGIGANDAANSFATSIGSKSLTLKQVIVLATIFEAAGAILMGGHVTKTIRKGIANYECFENEPHVFMYGCMWVCFSVGAWLFIASKYEMPVSTTHSCVGGMIGMTIALKGPKCVIWYEEKNTFPYIGGVSGIILSWVISPLFSAIFAGILFGSLRKFVLRLKDSFKFCIYVFPLIVGCTVTLNTFYIVYKGAKGIGLNEIPLEIASAWSFGLGSGSALLTIPMFKYYLQPFIENKFNELQSEKTIENDDNFIIGNIELINNDDNHDHDNQNHDNVYKLDNDFDSILNNDNKVLNIHKNAEIFDEKTEEIFKTLQVFTAICDSFSHGANDVANAIGPYAAIYMVYKDNELKKKNDLDSDAYWILAMGGIGISLGLAIYGNNIIQAIGIKLCKITPSRGISIELASALTIITGSRLEIPLSTTHCQVGATIGVGLLEDIKNCSGINPNIFFKTLFGWIATLIVVSVSTGLLVSQGAYAPQTTGY